MARSTDEASRPGPTETGECGAGVVAGAWQPEQSTSRRAGETGVVVGRGVCACERAQHVGACVMIGVWLSRLRSRGERTGGVDAMQGL
jgi:hypothetical protein